ncbi:MAG TPA: hypothetical protein VLE49_12855, partial [Anaerolineales bacterium]|nr:hypothetical protein [Anaerolineales bacterium]
NHAFWLKKLLQIIGNSLLLFEGFYVMLQRKIFTDKTHSFYLILCVRPNNVVSISGGKKHLPAPII